MLRAAEERGLRVPEDVTVVGYDNIYATTINRVSLTTVDQSGHSTGAASVHLLLERLNGRTEPKQFVVAPQLIPCRTSGPLRTAFVRQELAAAAAAHDVTAAHEERSPPPKDSVRPGLCFGSAAERRLGCTVDPQPMLRVELQPTDPEDGSSSSRASRPRRWWSERCRGEGVDSST